MVNVPNREYWQPGEEVKADKMKRQVNDFNDVLSKQDHLLIQGIDKTYPLKSGQPLAYLSIAGEPDVSGGWGKPTGTFPTDYNVPVDGVYFLYAEFSPGQPPSANATDLATSIQLRLKHKKAGQTKWEWRHLSNAIETNRYIHKDRPVHFSVQTFRSMYLRKGEAIMFTAYLGHPEEGTWSSNWAPEWKYGAPASNRVIVWRMDFGATDYEAPFHVPMPAVKPWNDGEVITAEKMNEQITNARRALSNTPRFSVHVAASRSPGTLWDVNWDSKYKEQLGDWKFNGTHATAPESGVYFIAADVSADGSTDNVPAYVKLYLNVDGKAVTSVDKQFQRKASEQQPSAATSLQVFSIRFLEKGQRVHLSVESQGTNPAKPTVSNFPANPSDGNGEFRRSSFSLHMIAPGAKSFVS